MSLYEMLKEELTINEYISKNKLSPENKSINYDEKSILIQEIEVDVGEWYSIFESNTGSKIGILETNDKSVLIDDDECIDIIDIYGE